MLAMVNDHVITRLTTQLLTTAMAGHNNCSLLWHFVVKLHLTALKNWGLFIPGPSSTDKGLPVLSTGSPTVTPADHEVKDHYVYKMAVWQVPRQWTFFHLSLVPKTLTVIIRKEHMGCEACCYRPTRLCIPLKVVYQQIVIAAFLPNIFGELLKNNNSINYKKIKMNKRLLLCTKKLAQNMSLWSQVLQGIMVASTVLQL